MLPQGSNTNAALLLSAALKKPSVQEANFISTPMPMMLTTQIRRIAKVMRFRFRSATPEEPAEEEIPPPNISERPPPLPLCIRIVRVSKMLVRVMMTMSVMFSAATFDFPILSETSTVCSLANNA